MRLADGLDEVLANATRTVVDPAAQLSERLLLEDDASNLFTYRLPLSRLIEASRSKRLHGSFRYRLAAAAVSRALVLRREADAREAVLAMRAVAPSSRADLDRYLTATTAAERHRAGLLLLLRTVGLHAYVPGRRDYTDEPIHRWMSESLIGSWWCVAEKGQIVSRYQEEPSGIDSMFLPTRGEPYPAFLTSTERAAVEQELAAIVALGHPQGYLAEEAVKWARAEPRDLRAAEALAHVVWRGRWSCSVPASVRNPASAVPRKRMGAAYEILVHRASVKVV